MSNIAIKGATTGTGVFTLESPATNTDRTLVLPDEAGTVLTTAGVPASAMPAGSVLQVVHGAYTSQQTLSPGSSWAEVTGLSATITPSSATSKILVSASINASGSTSNYVVTFRLYRNGSYIEVSPNNSLRPGTFITIGAQQWNNYFRYQATGVYLDSPASTSSLTYKLYTRDTRDNGVVFINSGYYDENGASNPVGYSSITLMEIAA